MKHLFNMSLRLWKGAPGFISVRRDILLKSEYSFSLLRVPAVCVYMCVWASRDPEIPLILESGDIGAVFNDSISPLPAPDGSLRYVLGKGFLCGLFASPPRPRRGPELLLHTQASLQTDSGYALCYFFWPVYSWSFCSTFFQIVHSLLRLKLWILIL